MKLLELHVDKILDDDDCQPRARLNWETIEEYAEALRARCEFPPVVVFFDGTSYWLASGFHRLHAHRKAGRKFIRADVRKGGKRDAVLFAVGTNVNHGMRRTNEDKRRAVLILLTDPEWGRWSAREISRRCGVSPALVDRVRDELSASERQMRDREEVKVTRNGTTYTMSPRELPADQKRERIEAATDDFRPQWRAEFWGGVSGMGVGQGIAERAGKCLAPELAEDMEDVLQVGEILRRIEKRKAEKRKAGRLDGQGACP